MNPRVSSCESPHPVGTLTDRLNSLLNTSGSWYTLSLCPGEQYFITAPVLFAAPNQEISTAGYPTDSTRATIIVNGSGQTTAVDGKCNNCDGVKLRNVKINGARSGGPPIKNGAGANIEMGGPNANQVVEYVGSYDPRGWSCLHVDQGGVKCTGAIIQHNDIGPAGSDAFQQWADGISIACRSSVIKNNTIKSPTDGAIVLFGAPGTTVEDNTIRAETHTLLGGINMVDIGTYKGNYTGVVVKNNTIFGGFATQAPQSSETDGANSNDVIIKIGIAIGPRTWSLSGYGNNVSFGGSVHDNQLTGAFGYGIAMSGVTNFTVEDNILIGNTSFIGLRGPNCTSTNLTPTPAPFVMDLNHTHKSTTQLNFSYVWEADNLICIVPPNGGDHWPFPPAAPAPSSTTSSNRLSVGETVGIVVGAIAVMVVVGAVIWYVGKWARRPSVRKGL